ncbi:hypothetical protein [Halorubrum trueperi]|uniref:Uncharacterized protein n=1 Tax=Halorubrum trueperi TaxID=2004704 RepID=A0ABD5UH05_9EURY
MLQYLTVVGIAAVVATLLMVGIMLYLVWWAMGEDAHRASPGNDEQPELDEADGSSESQGELPADGNSV